MIRWLITKVGQRLSTMKTACSGLR